MFAFVHILGKPLIFAPHKATHSDAQCLHKAFFSTENNLKNTPLHFSFKKGVHNAQQNQNPISVGWHPDKNKGQIQSSQRFCMMEQAAALPQNCTS